MSDAAIADAKVDPSPDRLVAIIVNYQSGWLAEACVTSLLYQWQREGRAREDLEVLVVENASPTDQSAHMGRIEAAGVRVLRSEENLGYARGMNWGYEHASWPEDGKRQFVAMLNPDLVLLEDSIGNLLNFLIENPDVGLVTPRAHIDLAQVVHLPRNTTPTPLDALRLNLAHRFAFAGRRYAARRLKRSIPWMESDEPIDTIALSGCCMFVPRAVIQDLGYLMDPRYPLYFEDTDLFKTLKAKGLRTVHLPAACILHHWSRSAGVDHDFAGLPAQRHAISQRLYFEKFHGKLGAWFMERMNALGARWAGRGVKAVSEIQELESAEEPPRLTWDRERRVVIEIGLTPNWLIAAGVLTEGRSFQFPESSWEWLFQCIYYIRVVDRDSLETVGAWRVGKSTPARERPVTLEELTERTREASRVG